MRQTQSRKNEFQLGTELLVAGNIRLAVTHLQQAHQDSPSDFRVRYNYVVALCMSGLRRKALALATELPVQQPLMARGYALLGLMFEINERFGEASSYYRAAHLLDPVDAKICALLGRDRLMREGASETQLLAQSISRKTERALPQLTALAVAGVLEDLKQSGVKVDSDRVLCGHPMGIDCFVARTPSIRSLQKTEWSKPNSKVIDIRQAADIVFNSRSVVAITGAGISSPSGLSTRKELWQIFDRDEAVSVWRARESPHVLWDAIKEFLGSGGHQPNQAHHALFNIPNLNGIVTQNVDGLHQLAQQATRDRCPILELHGTLDRTYCWNCNACAESCFELIQSSDKLPPVCTSCGGQLRPDVVLFGETVQRKLLVASKKMVKAADVVLVVGCAMDVAPASELPRLAAASGAVIIELKRNFSRLSRTLTTNLLRGCASETLPALVKRIQYLHESRRA